ncbi:hypothetical protein HOE37_05705 [Candidatus Woesearchaeota archaeon]|nr:hypothetical protein [Candidatus Woesearchaeota archaeon]MBT4336493.1 hypothetical protein [Candidatus Woesearchaeota archaeon]MBT4469906.1 hypothetical protein [Candidatus Woesearchaeota archaeon]MBT6744423.1 hypothetical protein [Candidatus Woesearchaeota archaeon]
MSERDYYNNLLLEVKNLRNYGLSDEYVFDELITKGYSEEEINWAFGQPDETFQNEEEDFDENFQEQGDYFTEVGNISTEQMIYEKVEEIVDTLIDEKWEELVKEVKKIIVFKERIEKKLERTRNDFDILNDDFLKMRNNFEIRINQCNKNIDTAIDLLSGVKLVGIKVIPEFVECVSSLR